MDEFDNFEDECRRIWWGVNEEDAVAKDVQKMIDVMSGGNGEYHLRPDTRESHTEYLIDRNSASVISHGVDMFEAACQGGGYWESRVSRRVLDAWIECIGKYRVWLARFQETFHVNNAKWVACTRVFDLTEEEFFEDFGDEVKEMDVPCIECAPGSWRGDSSLGYHMYVDSDGETYVSGWDDFVSSVLCQTHGVSIDLTEVDVHVANLLFGLGFLNYFGRSCGKGRYFVRVRINEREALVGDSTTDVLLPETRARMMASNFN